MAAVAPQPKPPAHKSPQHPLTNGKAADHATTPNGSASTGRPAASKKAAGKKAADPSETSKLLAAKISQLESDQAGEKDQEIEIEREVKRANRDLSNLLSNIESPLSRLDVVQKKYTDLLAEMRRLDRDHVKNKKRAEQLQKERDSSRMELSKMGSMKEKLEKLSRELAKEKQKIKEEMKKLQDTEQKKREQLNAKIDAILWEVQEVDNERTDPMMQRSDIQVDELSEQQLKALCNQYELREQVFAHILDKKETEVHENMTRFEKEKRAAEQEVARSRDLRMQVATFSQTETELRNQLNVYVVKFKQVEDTLNNSNDLFLTFRKEMEDMSRKTKRLEKENLTLIRKHDQTNRNILEMAEERTRMSKEMDLLKKKNMNLEKLCRGMQAQGRGVSAQVSLRAEGETENENGRTESEYEYDEDEEDDEGEEGDEDEGDCEDGGIGGEDEHGGSMMTGGVVEAQTQTPHYGPARAPQTPMKPQASHTFTNGSGDGSTARGRTSERK
ncbi:MAG: hypothetical protein M1823_004835 [Watsoniomyces obsoletus]|nr:MAG: hypothetical protein M1823_004835 [Watsoniomyces obsoletus]